MRLVALALLLATTAEAQRAYPLALPRGCRDRSCVRGRAVQPSSSPVVVVPNISNAITAGDKAGNWWALQTDGTMLSGSSLTMSATGSPGVSPLTFNGSTQFEGSSNVTFPSTSQSFTVVYVAKFNSVSTAYVVAKWPAASQTFICGVDTNPVFFAFTATPTFVSTTDVGHIVPTGAWVGMACTFNSGTGMGTVRYLATDTSSSFSTDLQTSTNPHKVAGIDAATASFNGQSRGAFYTEKVLSDADIDRIIAGAM